jgi:hypothetical protein
MSGDYAVALAAGFAVAVACWAALMHMLPWLWSKPAQRPFAQPWREVGWALVGVIGVIAVGQLYMRGIRVPARGPWRPLLESINQFMIFLPLLAVPALRGQAPETAWLRRHRVPWRLSIGIGLSLAAVIAFCVTARDAASPWNVIPQVWRLEHAHIATQVLLEDVAIAILVVRLAAAIGALRAVLLAAALFAASHVPALLAAAAPTSEIVGLLRDAVLAAAVAAVAVRAADVWVLWPIHFAMDMMQFVSGARP